MRIVVCLLLLFSMLSPIGFAQHEGHHHQPSPYVEDTSRTIKALSAGDMQGYLEGRGMGLARAAELNSYPGPLHVLELADELDLTEEQVSATQHLRQTVVQDAVKLGRRIVEQEGVLDTLFANGSATKVEVQAVTAEIGVLQGLLRAVHLAAHVEMKRILTPEQIARYDELRGYGF